MRPHTLLSRIPRSVGRYRRKTQAVPTATLQLPTTTARGTLSIGSDPTNKSVTTQEYARHRHCHIIGATGSGKTTTLEHIIRQDIMNGHGVAVLDPHGSHSDSLYNRLLAWLHDSNYISTRRVRIIEPGNRDWVFSINPLMAKDTSPSVVADRMLSTFERAADDENLAARPTIERILPVLFALMHEQGLALPDAILILDPHDGSSLRQKMIEQSNDDWAKFVLKEYDDLIASNPRDGRSESLGPLNRFARFLRDESARLALGQTDVGFDVVDAMDQQDIVLVNLQSDNHVGEKTVQLIGTILVREFFEKSKQRKHPKRPFYLTIDECQQYLSGDIARILDECRKFGLHAILSHQRIGQLAEAGDNVKSAVKSGTYVKIVMGGLSSEEAQEMADDILTLNTEQPVEALIKPTVVDYEIIDLLSQSSTETQGSSTGISQGTTHAQGVANSRGVSSSLATASSIGISSQPDHPFIEDPTLFNRMSESETTAEASSKTSASVDSVVEAHSQTNQQSTSQSTGTTTGSSQTLKPILEDRPTAVHSLENMRYMAGRQVRNLDIGQALVAIGNTEPVLTKVPLVRPVPASQALLTEIRHELLSRDPAAKPRIAAQAHFKARQQQLTQQTEVLEPQNFRQVYNVQ